MSHHTRSTLEVFEHHANALNTANFDEIAFDYAMNGILITKDDGVVKGREAIKKWFTGVLTGPLVGAQFTATTLTIEGEVLYLEWSAPGTTHNGTGVDTFFIRGGEIQVQTVKVLSLAPK